MGFYSKAAMERAMKVQEVILRAMAKKITWWQAAEIIGISDRQMRRWHERLEEFGYEGLFDRRRGRPSPKRVSLATVEQVLGLYRDRYFDLNVQHFHEKLRAEHQIGLSYTWVKAALQGAGLVAKGRKRGVHRKRRERRPLPGMLLHIDGSRHQWFQDERWYDLIVILDDATSAIYHAKVADPGALFVPHRAVGGDGRHQHNHAVLGQQIGNEPNPSDVLVAILLAEAKVLAEMLADHVAIQKLHFQSPAQRNQLRSTAAFYIRFQPPRRRQLCRRVDGPIPEVESFLL